MAKLYGILTVLGWSWFVLVTIFLAFKSRKAIATKSLNADNKQGGEA